MDHSFGVFALCGAAGAEEVFVFDNPELLAVIKAEFFSGFYVRRGEETNPRKPKILMVYENLEHKEQKRKDVLGASVYTLQSFYIKYSK